MPSVSKQEAIQKQKRKLCTKEEEAIARILCLRAQQKLLEEREERIINRRLQFLKAKESSYTSFVVSEALKSPKNAVTTTTPKSLRIPSPKDPFQDLFNKGILLGGPLNSVGSPLVPIYYLFRYILSI